MKLCLCICGALFIGLSSPAAPARAGIATAGTPAGTTWSFQANFRRGIPGWISYPLAQDEGYDPSIYTTEVDGSPALVRDVTANGQRVLRVGMLRALHFDATPSAAIALTYKLESCGPVTNVRVILAASSGHKYIAGLSSGVGKRAARLTGNQFGLPARGAAIDALVIEALIAHPLRGAHNRLTLFSVQIRAERPAALPLERPLTVISPASGVSFASRVVTPHSSLMILMLGGPPGAHVRFADGAGKLIREEPLQKKTGAWQARFTPPEDNPGLWSATVQSSAGVRTFLFLVLGKVPAHPRVLLTSARLAQLKSMRGAGVLRASIDREAARLRERLAYNERAGENISLLSPASVFPGLIQYFQLMESYSRAIAFNALDYQLTGSPEALDSTRKALLTISAWPTWTPPWFHAHGLQTYYEVGVFTQRVAVGDDLIANHLTSDEKSRIARALWRNSIQPTLEDYFFNDRLPTASSNHMANSVGGAIAACVALYGDEPGLDRKLGAALGELLTAYEGLLQGLFPGDGSEAEPAGYEDFAMEGMSYGAAALQAFGIHPRGLDRMLGGFHWLRYAFFAPGEVLDTGDTGGQLQSLSGYAWGAENGGDPALRAFYDSAKSGTLARFISSGAARNAEPPSLLDLTCCTGPAPSVPARPLAHIFSMRGSAVMRSDWTPGSTVISLRAGPWWNHEHHDQGSFQAAAFGEPLIAEAGYADYYRDPRYADYFSQAPGHNVVLVDDDPFSQEDYDGRYWPALRRFPTIRGHVFSPALDFISADLAPAYNDGIHLKNYVRDYVFMPPDVLIVHDALRGQEEHKYTFLLHPPPGDRVTINGGTAIIHGKGAIAAITAQGADRRWTVHPAPVPENAYANLDRVNVLPRRVLRLDSNSSQAADFAVAMRFQKSSEAAAPLQPITSSAGEGFRSANGSLRILFRRGPGPLDLDQVLGWRDVSSDGDVLAAKHGAAFTAIFAARAKVIETAGGTPAGWVLLASRPAAVDAVIGLSATGEEVEVDCLAKTRLTIHMDRRPRTLLVDRKALSLAPGNGFQPMAFSFAAISQGHHVIRIQY